MLLIAAGQGPSGRETMTSFFLPACCLLLAAVPNLANILEDKSKHGCKSHNMQAVPDRDSLLQRAAWFSSEGLLLMRFLSCT